MERSAVDGRMRDFLLPLQRTFLMLFRREEPYNLRWWNEEAIGEEKSTEERRELQRASVADLCYTNAMYYRLCTAILVWLFAPRAHATLSTGNFGIEQSSGALTIPVIVNNVVSVAVNSIGYVCTAVFIAGAVLFAASAGDEQRKSLGKDLMIGAVIGIAIVAGARGILNLAYFFMYAP
ncbi:MAG TPA: hypothetical protein VJB10_05355 [Candidatus Peribacteraceae bacterium]|nr:hypothetical protein [Candidatus Peribacteraceae bacterium]